jgi:hypothetical protein
MAPEGASTRGQGGTLHDILECPGLPITSLSQSFHPGPFLASLILLSGPHHVLPTWALHE